MRIQNNEFWIILVFGKTSRTLPRMENLTASVLSEVSDGSFIYLRE